MRLTPGQTARVGGYEITYVRPLTRLEDEKLSLGAVLDVRRDGRRWSGCARRAATTRRAAAETGARALLRGPGHQRGRAGSRAAPRPVDRGRARPAGPAPVHRGGRPSLPRRHPGAAGFPDRRDRRALGVPTAAGDLPPDRLAAGDLDLARGGDRGGRRADRDVAGAVAARARRAPSAAHAGRAPPARPAARRRRLGPVQLVLVVVGGRCRGSGRAGSSPRRCAADDAGDGQAGRPTSARWRPRATPSTARSARPSWTCATGKLSRRTGRRSTAACAPRRSRSCTRWTGWRPGPAPLPPRRTARPIATIGVWSWPFPSFRSWCRSC